MGEETKREQLGRLVREEWVRFAQTQLHPKPGHLVEWDKLDATNRELDSRIGVRLYLMGVDESDVQRAEGAVKLLGWEPDAFEPYLDRCSPVALREILVILEPDTGDAREESLSAYARREIQWRLAALSRPATPPKTPGDPQEKGQP